MGGRYYCQVVGPQRTTRTPPSVGTFSGRKRVLNSDDDDIEASADGFSEGGSLQEAEALLRHPILQ